MAVEWAFVYAAGDGEYIAVESADTANLDLCCGAGYEKASICTCAIEVVEESSVV